MRSSTLIESLITILAVYELVTVLGHVLSIVSIAAYVTDPGAREALASQYPVFIASGVFPLAAAIFLLAARHRLALWLAPADDLSLSASATNLGAALLTVAGFVIVIYALSDGVQTVLTYAARSTAYRGSTYPSLPDGWQVWAEIAAIATRLGLGIALVINAAGAANVLARVRPTDSGVGIAS
jgi:hypothetical protein